MAHRYFTSDIRGAEAFITGSDAAHLARVLRVRPGDTLPLCDGAGSDYVARVEAAAPDEVRFTLLEKEPSRSEPALQVLCCLAWAKGDKNDWAVQKAVEAGAAAFCLFPAAGSVAKPKSVEKRLERLSRIAAEAAKQSARGILPPVEAADSFGTMLERAAAWGGPLLCTPEGGAPLRQVLAGKSRVALLTGPESGFTSAEVAQARAAGAEAVTLGPRILRCETAPVVALAAAMVLAGELD